MEKDMLRNRSFVLGILVAALSLGLLACGSDDEGGSEVLKGGACGTKEERRMPACWFCQLSVNLSCVDEIEACDDAIAAYGACEDACGCEDDGDCEIACVGKCDAELVEMLACYKKVCPETDCL